MTTVGQSLVCSGVLFIALTAISAGLRTPPPGQPAAIDAPATPAAVPHPPPAGPARVAAPRRGPVEDYEPALGLAQRPETQGSEVVLRTFAVAGERRFLLVDPTTLNTRVVPAAGMHVTFPSQQALDAALETTPYGRAIQEGRRRADPLTDAGVTHGAGRETGVNLTIDLCPSGRPLDRRIFTAVLDQLERVEHPVPVAVAVTGAWMQAHVADLNWLVGLDQSGRLAITWVNHSLHHHVSATQPLERNFLLEPGTDVREEVLATERLLIERGLTPSVFFRFPGLVSSRALVETILGFGLIPLGSDAWLAKGQEPRPGSIVLIHGNGNEPLGVRRFLDLLAHQRDEVRQHRWLLLDLRSGLIDNERQDGR
jgi:hypothetical protein